MRLVPLLAARSPLAAGPALALPTPLVLGAASLSAFGLRDTGAGRTLTAPMLSFALCLGLSNIGLLPAASPAYEFCWKRLLPLAVSLGLLSASAGAPRGSNDGELRPMLLAFGVGAVGTIVGAFVAFGACTRLGLYSTAQAAVAAALLAATYVGGSANFFGVASAVASPARDGSLVASLLAADLGLMAIYLLALTAAARSPPLRRAFPEPTPGKYAAAVAAAIPPPAASTLAGALVPKQLWRVAGVGIALLACGAAAVVDHNVGLAGSGTSRSARSPPPPRARAAGGIGGARAARGRRGGARAPSSARSARRRGSGRSSPPAPPPRSSPPSSSSCTAPLRSAAAASPTRAAPACRCARCSSPRTPTSAASAPRSRWRRRWAGPASSRPRRPPARWATRSPPSSASRCTPHAHESG